MGAGWLAGPDTFPDRPVCVSVSHLNCILVLEDEPIIAFDLQQALEDVGIKAVMARNCKEAAKRMADSPIDGAILDVNLGHGETCERVALALRAKSIPFILNTGDLDRSGELLRKIEAPIVAKPTPAEMVVDRLLELARRETASN
jgi:DNA-binding response OmpR family regulator